MRNVTEQAPDVAYAWDAKVFKDADGNLTIKAKDNIPSDRTKGLAGMAMAETNTRSACVTIDTPSNSYFYCRIPGVTG